MAAVDEPGGELTSDDAYIRRKGDAWVIGTVSVERTIALEDGRLRLRSFKSKRSGRELIPAGTIVDELPAAIVGAEGEGPWKLQGAKPSQLKQGELQLELTLPAGRWW